MTCARCLRTIAAYCSIRRLSPSIRMCLVKAAERKVMNDNYQIFVRPLADGSHAVALLNTSEKPLTLTADFASLGFAGKYTVRDVWQHKDVARNTSKWKGRVMPHETRVFVVKK